MSKIFGEFTNMEDLNKTAMNLRDSGETEEIILLGQENEIPEEEVNKFINKEIDYLVKIIASKQQGQDIINEYLSSIEKIERELDESKVNNVPAAPIAKHLISKCEVDSSLSSRVLLKDKSLKDCLNYVYQEVKKIINGACGWIDDPEVYKIAEDYFILDNIKIETKISEGIKKKENFKNDDIKELVNTKELIDTKPKNDNIKNKITKEKEILTTGQVSLFDC